MKYLFICFLAFIFVSNLAAFTQEKINDVFDIKNDRFSRTSTLKMKKPMIIKNEQYTLSLSLERHIFLKHPEPCFKKGYLFIAVNFEISGVTDTDTANQIQILFSNGEVLSPNLQGDFFSIENNIYKQITDKRVKDDYKIASTQQIEAIRISVDFVNYDFELSNEESKLLRKYIAMVGNYSFY